MTSPRSACSNEAAVAHGHRGAHDEVARRYGAAAGGLYGLLEGSAGFGGERSAAASRDAVDLATAAAASRGGADLAIWISRPRRAAARAG